MHSLNHEQRDVIREIMEKKKTRGGLSLPLGFGKTRTSIALALEQTKKSKDLILIIVSKTILAGWIDEITKVFGDSLDYEILHKSYLKNFNNWKPKDSTRIVITTPETVMRTYINFNIEFLHVHHIVPSRFTAPFIEYILPIHPLLSFTSGPELLYSVKWGCVIIDEIHRYIEVTTSTCRSIACVCALNRWGSSGTMFTEPRVEQILGFLIILHLPGPRTIPDTKKYIKHFDGLNQFLIQRKKDVKSDSIYIEKIIKHNLSPEELLIFKNMRLILNALNDKVKEFKHRGDVDGVRKYSAYQLAMISYVRQSVVCPIIPITSMYCDMADYQGKSELSKIMTDKIVDMKLEEYLTREENICSTRFKAIIDVIVTHTDEKCVVFSSFRTILDVLRPLITRSGRNVLSLDSKHSTAMRLTILNQFKESKNDILLLTYNIGSEGLNLQCASVALLVDLWWNESKTEQAIGRIYRQGQMAPEVSVYFFISNTGMESKMIEKNVAKEVAIAALCKGRVESITIPKLTINDMIKIINLDDNETDIKLMRHFV